MPEYKRMVIDFCISVYLLCQNWLWCSDMIKNLGTGVNIVYLNQECYGGSFIGNEVGGGSFKLDFSKLEPELEALADERCVICENSYETMQKY